MQRIRLTSLFAALLLASGAGLATPPAATEDAPVTPMTPDMYPGWGKLEQAENDYVRRVEMIPMRDGARLYTVIAYKKGTRNAPILLTRTPYNAARATQRMPSTRLVDILPVMDKEFVEDGYIRVYQDIRGRDGSEGTYVMNRPISGPLNDTGIDESTDAYDTIDWLVKNLPESNGNVGIIGSSYPGFTALVATINPHPALKASVPQSPMVDGWIGDDWFHNGAFRPWSLDYITRQTTHAGSGQAIPSGGSDEYLKFLQAGSVGDYARKYGVDRFPFYRKLAENPAYTSFWSGQAVDRWVAERPFTVPTMLVIGQWDQEDSYGAPRVYEVLKDKPGAQGKLHLVIGPWRHSGVNYQGDTLGALKFPGDTALEFRTRYLKPFLDHHLKGAANPRLPAALTYETGSNRWNLSATWPVGKPTPLYLQPGAAAGFDKPASAGHDQYVSDPSKPVPFLPRPIRTKEGDSWRHWLVADQRFASGRPDVLEYTTAPLDKPVHVMGAPLADLYASTSGSDSDWVVKLIDVYPDGNGYDPAMAGYELAVGIEIFRGRYVDGFDKPRALVPGKVEHYRFALPNVDHTFLPGHRIKVVVQSSLFPAYDRNPQTFVDNIFNALPQDYVPATQRIHTGGPTPSAVLLPVVR